MLESLCSDSHVETELIVGCGQEVFTVLDANKVQDMPMRKG